MATAPRPDGHHAHAHPHRHLPLRSGAERDHRPGQVEPTLPPSRDGSVVMELGGSIGALVLYTGADLEGAEIDLFVPGADRPFVHSAVRARHLVSGTCHAAVYPDLPAGEYVIAAHGEVGPTAVRVVGGRITEVPVGGGARRAG